MTDDKITPLKLVPSLPHDADEGAVLHSIKSFLETLGLLTDYTEDDIEFEPTHPDEKRLGPLNSFEKELFMISTLLGSVCDDAVKSLEADNLEKITAIMRKKGVGFDDAVIEFVNTANLEESDQLTALRQAVVVRATAGTLYEFSVRKRYDAWYGGLIVRSGFIVYNYG